MSLLFRGRTGRRARRLRRSPPVRGARRVTLVHWRVEELAESRRFRRAVTAATLAALLLAAGTWAAPRLHRTAARAGWLGPRKTVVTPFGLTVEACYADEFGEAVAAWGTDGAVKTAALTYRIDGREITVLHDSRGTAVIRGGGSATWSDGAIDYGRYDTPPVPLPPATKTLRLSLSPAGRLRAEADGTPLPLN